MKRIFGVAVVLALAATASFAPGALAANPACPAPNTPGLMFDWDANCVSYETNYIGPQLHSLPGSKLVVVGKLTIACPPFDDLLPDPSNEYTFVFDNLTSLGTDSSSSTQTTKRKNCNYGTGRFRIFKDPAMNAPNAGSMPAPPGGGAVIPSFEDGTLLLQGTLPSFRTNLTKTGSNPWVGSFRTDSVRYQATGTLYPRTATVVPGIVQGLWCVTDCFPTGYTAHPDGKIDGRWDAALPTATHTWGAIKILYR